MPNDMRDRLIELLTDNLPHCDNPLQDTYDEIVERLANHLIENGAIIPPCKVGDTVYYPWIYDGQCGVAFNKVESIKIYVNGLPLVIVEDWGSDMPMPISFCNEDFGKTVFLTREDAEKALGEREGE